MKKILFMLWLLLPLFKVNALIVNDETVITEKGIVLSKEEYNKISSHTSDAVLDMLDEKIIRNVLNNKSINETYYIVTNYKYNTNHQIIKSYEIITTEENAKLVAKNKNYYFTEEGKLKYNVALDSFKTYSTDSKVVHLDYYNEENQGNSYTIHIWGEWYKMPMIRQFDIIAARWDVNNSDTSIYGVQESDQKTTFYDNASNNIKRSNNGLGLSINLHDNAKKNLSYELYIYSNKSFGDRVYGTYQHAKHSNANTLEISKSYTFGPNGLGGVVYFSNSKYRSYYDGMKGLIN